MVARKGHGAQKFTISGPDIIMSGYYVWPRYSIFAHHTGHRTSAIMIYEKATSQVQLQCVSAGTFYVRYDTTWTQKLAVISLI